MWQIINYINNYINDSQKSHFSHFVKTFLWHKDFDEKMPNYQIAGLAKISH